MYFFNYLEHATGNFTETSTNYVASVYQYFLWKNTIHEEFGPTLLKTSCNMQNRFIIPQRSDLQTIL